MKRVGVLSLQGDVREHETALRRVGASVTQVRRPNELTGLDGLVIPGGESTTMAYLLNTSGLREPLADALAQGLAVFGTCAGLILLSREISDGRADQWSYGRLDVAVRRNGFGRQRASFETTLSVKGLGDVSGVFIRAPRITRVGDDVAVLAVHDNGDGDEPVFVRSESAWGASFHPELTADVAIHEMFVRSL